MNNSTIQQYNYHQWANDRTFNHLSELPDEIYDNEIESVFSSISEVITHLYQVDAMWLSVMSGDAFEETMAKLKEIKRRSANKGLEQIQKLYAELSERYQPFLNDVADLDADISVNHPQYGTLETTVSELVQHVVNHGTYHRGNITAMLRQQGHSGVQTDFVFYLYEIA
ncbi:DinB family protein [Fodinibius halophilus]|uniref:Damage-inducible protein DinB n=1 Tax=Fodinibius halophilus TaxID=1736908 RepID=A0A6M1TEL7_9BACT|nr:DinB family protein [Fodinibius halophilus]NGP87080.1 damage-inducible protein DinB [Fodinibius halophilus]